MKRIIFLKVSLFFWVFAFYASTQNQSFQEFRNGIMNDYTQFKNTLLEQYADFLNGEWHEYQSLKGENKYKTPKPESVPEITPDFSDFSQGTVGSPELSESISESPHVPEPISPSKISPSDISTSEGPLIKDNLYEISFFEIPLTLPKIEFSIKRKLTATSDYAEQWKTLADRKVAEKVLPGIKKLSSSMGLNDYLTFLLIKSYIESIFPDTDDSSRFSAIHYLLANMGYDIRIATTPDGIPILLIPFKQLVYGRIYLLLDGKKYYALGPDSEDERISEGSTRILTCSLPEKVDKGRDVELLIGELKLPYKPFCFELKGGKLRLSGEINVNIIPILYKYPQMEMDGYALSNILPELRMQLVKQIKDQTCHLPEREGVNALLEFTQKAFQYSTDDSFHGFEKPYFLEETLFYPRNDCEDRAIFYTYFLSQALGKKTQLISFPGHEAASVALDDPIDGASYNDKGTTYYISDPTFIGSKTGMIMPSCKGEPMTIDYSYE